MSDDQPDAGVTFAWDERLRIRVETRARQIQRRRRTVFRVLGTVVVLLGATMLVAIRTLTGPSGVRVATTAPDPTAALARLLPSPASVIAVIPQLSLKPAGSGDQYGVMSAAELASAHGAQLGVARQWDNGTGNVELQPGQQFPDEVQTVISTIITFDTSDDALAWTRQSAALVHTPVDLRGAGSTPGDLVVIRGAGFLDGEIQYLAAFTDGATAFGLQMVAGGSGAHDHEFVQLVQDWTAQVLAGGPPTTAAPSTHP